MHSLYTNEITDCLKPASISLASIHQFLKNNANPCVCSIALVSKIICMILKIDQDLLLKLQIYHPSDPTTTLIPKTSKTSPVSLAFFQCLIFSLVLWLLTSTFTAFPMFLKVFGYLEHTNNCYIFSISWSK